MNRSFLSVLFKQAHKQAKNIRHFFVSYAQAFRIALKASRKALANVRAQANTLRHALERLSLARRIGEPDGVAVWQRAVAFHRDMLADAREALL